MPANLTPDFKAAEERFRQAKTNEEKLAALEEMLRVVPKHKGTDHLQGDIKARIAKLKKQPAKKGATRTVLYNFPREGAGQIALVGPPNGGKSSLLTSLTKAHAEVADYPFTTREPSPGMMPFEDIAFQLIDLPPLAGEHIEPWLFDIVRRADLVWFVVDGTDALGSLDDADAILRGKNILLLPGTSAPPEELALSWTVKRVLVVATHADEPAFQDGLAVFEEFLDRQWPVIGVSTLTGEGLDTLGQRTFGALGIMRVYTKQPGKPPDRTAPFTLDRGATVGDLATRIHKDIHAKLKFARIWGAGVFDGQTVQHDHVLQEGNVVELHA